MPRPAIQDYGYIGDCHSSALISKQGSIDWCCMPRVDSASCFGRLLDWRKAGYCQLCPTGSFTVTQRYQSNSMILETYFQSRDAKAVVIDFFPMREGGMRNPYQQIIRIVIGISGKMQFKLNLLPRFDYGTIKPWIKPYKHSAFIAMGGSHGLLISGDLPLKLKTQHELTATFTVKKNSRFHLSILYNKPAELDKNWIQVPSVDELEWRLQETQKWWCRWFEQAFPIEGPYAPLVARSALVLKALSNAPTGAIAAAATTSLPESPHRNRNWDYRYSWVRDSYFSVHSLAQLGFVKEAEGFGRFIARSSHSSAEGLQVVFGVAGETRLQEYTLPLSGYKRARPVRIGNAAAGQLQFDIYGELLALAWNWHQCGYTPDRAYWDFLVEIIEFICENWTRPDSGIWEMRDHQQHFVLSKVMCWIALDCGLKLAHHFQQDVPLAKWRRLRRKIRQTIETEGYDAKRGIFIQAFGNPHLDGGLLLMPIIGFIEFDDERMIRTTDAIWKELQEDGLLLRYPRHTDDFKSEEGVFLACSFWLVICLAKQNRFKFARKVFERALATGNHLGLFSEEYDTKTGQMLGNFPQALTHLSFITAALALQKKSFQKTNFEK
ncbi:MAG: glycoside hydrolase family 15 protein [Gammaproteobacteria bacterium]